MKSKSKDLFESSDDEGDAELTNQLVSAAKKHSAADAREDRGRREVDLWSSSSDSDGGDTSTPRGGASDRQSNGNHRPVGNPAKTTKNGGSSRQTSGSVPAPSGHSLPKGPEGGNGSASARVKAASAASSEVKSTNGNKSDATKENQAGRKQHLDLDAQSGSGDEGNSLRINRTYAEKYEGIKRKQELQRLVEKYGTAVDSDESDEEDDELVEDDDGVLLTPEKELAFARSFLAIRASLAGRAGKEAAKGADGKKRTATSREDETEDSDIENIPNVFKEKSTRFFGTPQDQIEANNKRILAVAQAASNKFTLKDEYQRETMKGVAAEAADATEEPKDRYKRENLRLRPQTAEERKIREEFLKKATEVGNEFAIEPALGNTAGAPAGVASKSERVAEKQRSLLAKAFALSDAESGAGGKKAKRDAQVVSGSDLDGSSGVGGGGNEADEMFIRDFFVKELWKPSSGGDGAEEQGKNYLDWARFAQEEQDEIFYEEAEEWEREYQSRQYRHEEGEEALQVQTFARPTAGNDVGLLRAKDSTRKQARERKLTRMEEARNQQVEELKRLKTLKRQEIEAQRRLILKVSGQFKEKHGKGESDGDHEERELARLKALWSEKDLEEDFDSVKFDQKMAMMFDDEYYADENVDEEELAYFESEEDGEEAAVDAVASGAAADGEGAVDDIPELFLAGSLDEALMMEAKRRREDERRAAKKSGTKTSKTEASALGGDDLEMLYPSHALRMGGDDDASGTLHAAPATSPGKSLQDLEAALEKRVDEYWKLHYQDVIGGDVKTRFRYREVPPEDFTLSTEEVLTRDDRQLNLIAPMSCYAAYLDKHANQRDRERIERRRMRGMRELSTDRRSRRYGDLTKTVVFDENMDEEQRHTVLSKLREGVKRLRDEEEILTASRGKAGREAGGAPLTSEGRHAATTTVATSANPSGRGGGGQPTKRPFHGSGWRGAADPQGRSGEAHHRGGRSRGGYAPGFRGRGGAPPPHPRPGGGPQRQP